MANPKDAIMPVLKDLRASGELSDFVLACGGREWRVHKLVLRMHSDVLYKMATSEQFVESKQGRAELKDVDSAHVDALVHFLYTLELPGYDDRERKSDEDLETNLIAVTIEMFLFHLGVAVVADKYNVRKLKELAEERLLSDREVEEARSCFSHLVDMAHDTEGLPQSLRDMLIKQAAEDISPLNTGEADDLLDRRPEFTARVLRLAAARAYENKLDEDDSRVGSFSDLSF